MTELIFFILGAAISCIVMFFLWNKNYKHKEIDLIQKISTLTEKTTNLNQMLEQQKLVYENKIQIQTEYFNKESHLQKSLCKELEKQSQQSKIEFENISQKVLQSKIDSYHKETEKSLQLVLSPLSEKITEFKKSIREQYESEGHQRFSLKQEIEKITEQSQNLTQALKGSTKVQGDWGEMILEKILQSSGLQEGSHFTIQGRELHLKNEEGKHVKPDIVVHLPNKQDIIIDSKVSLVSYHDYISSQSKEDQKIQVKLIAESLRKHIKNLSEKKYDQSQGVNSLDFVLMFIPIEAVISLAFQEQQELFDFALKKSIIIVHPTSLLSTLKTIGALWKISKQNKHTQDIAKTAGEMYDKLEGFLTSLQNLEKGLKQAQNSYDQAINRLKDGKSSLFQKAEKLKTLGAKTIKTLPDMS